MRPPCGSLQAPLARSAAAAALPTPVVAREESREQQAAHPQQSPQRPHRRRRQRVGLASPSLASLALVHLLLAGSGAGRGGPTCTLAAAFPSSSLRAPPASAAASFSSSLRAAAAAAGGAALGVGARRAPVVASVLFGGGGGDSSSPSINMVVTRRGGGGRGASPTAAAAAAPAARGGGGVGVGPLQATADAVSAGGPTFVETYDGMRRHKVAWDAERRRFSVVQHRTPGDGMIARMQRYLRQSFLPEHVTPDYYHYTKWRVLQRLISATVSVFGTRALLLALGLKTERVGLTATFNWIQKDAFGKLGRIMWASKMGRRFDSDAKRWRFRSSLLFAAGTGLEVLTYLFPAAFLLLATVANILKQMSMLTSSATRNAMYKSFAGDSQNLGDITAKGEAQIAVVDLLGILLGISLSKAIGTAQAGMGVAYIALSMVDVFAIYNEIRSVVFSSLNLERGAMVARAFVKGDLPTPHAVSRQERIFWDPEAIDPKIFRTVSQTGCSLDELHRLRAEAFADERFLLSWSPGKEGTSIVLHDKAGAHDILRALLTWAYFVEAWAGTEAAERARKVYKKGDEEESGRVREQVFGLLRDAHKRARESEKPFHDALAKQGWDMRHFVFGKIKRRTDW